MSTGKRPTAGHPLVLPILAALVLVPSGAFSAANDSQFPKLGSCEKNWTETEPLKDQLTKILAYENCVEAYRVSQEVRVRTATTVDDTQTASEEAAKAVVAKKNAADAEKEKKDEKKFLGFDWGVGFGAALGRGDARISEAEIVDGIVRVKKDVSDSPRLVLELHNFVWRFEIGKQERTAGFGPFGAVNFGASDGNTLTSFGLGLMLGVKQENGDRSFNIGVGLMLDQDVQVLGDGFVANEAPPGMEEAVRFKTESQESVLVFVSTTF